MHDPPPSVYENWPAPNYVDPETRGAALTIINSSACALVILVVLARCYTRTRITGSFGLDDVFICLALIPSLGLTGCTLASERVFGWNRHVWDATASQIHGGLILEFASGILYIQSSLLTKLSVVFFCRRLLSDSHPQWYRRALDAFAVMTFAGCMAYTITFCLSCQPLQSYWDHYPPNWEPDYPYHCIDIGYLWLSGSILNASWDLLTWLVPLPIVLQLQLPIRQRIAVMGLFALGLAVVAAAVMKTIYVQAAFNESYDITWTGYPSWICGALEIDIGILCASIPSLRPLFSHFCPRVGAPRWPVRRSYNRMSKGRDSPEDATPLSPLSPLSNMSPTKLRLDTNFSTDHMKPWSKGRSARSSISIPGASPASPGNTTPKTPNSRRLTPLTEILPVAQVTSFNEPPTLLPPEDEAMQRHFEDPDKVLSTPPASATSAPSHNGKAVFSVNSTAPLPPLEQADANPKRDGEHDTAAPKKTHSRKTSSASAAFEGFNFTMPATSSRRTSQGTAPSGYGDFVSQHSFIDPEEDRDRKKMEVSPRSPPGQAH